MAWDLLQGHADTIAAGSGAANAHERPAIIAEAYTGTNFHRSGASAPDEMEIPFSVPFLSTSPTLTELPRAALNRLNVDEDGLYVSIEGGAVDRAMHANNIGRMIEEYIEFNDTVKFVVGRVNSPESRATLEDAC